MHKVFIPAFCGLLLLILQACSKDNIDTRPLTGKYQLTQITGGIAGATTKYSVFDPYFLQLKTDSSYILNFPLSGLPKAADTGVYSIAIQPATGGKDTIITMRSRTFLNSFLLNRSGNTLYLTTTDFSDGYMHRYVKVGN